MQALGLQRCGPDLASSRPHPIVACRARHTQASRLRTSAVACTSASAPATIVLTQEPDSFLAPSASTMTVKQARPATTLITTPTPATTQQVHATSSPAVAAPEGVCELLPATFEQFISVDGLVLVDFYTDYCGPCKLMHEHFYKLQGAFKKIKFAKYNCGLEGHEPLATRQRIRSLPTFRLYRAGRFLEEVTGARPVQLRQMLVHWYR